MKRISIWSSDTDSIEGMKFEEFVQYLQDQINESPYSTKQVKIDVNNTKSYTDVFLVELYVEEADLTTKQKALSKLTDEDKKALGLM